MLNFEIVHAVQVLQYFLTILYINLVDVTLGQLILHEDFMSWMKLVIDEEYTIFVVLLVTIYVLETWSFNPNSR